MAPSASRKAEVSNCIRCPERGGTLASARITGNPSPMPQHPDNLAWIDLEMTGLVPESDRIIELATIVTDRDLNVLAEGPLIALRQDEATLARMDEWNRRTHGDSGLTTRVRASTVDEAEAERRTLAFPVEWVAPGVSPMCGN